MTSNNKDYLLHTNASRYLQYLSTDLPTRRVGSPGNRAATDFCARVIRAAGFQVITPEFSCLDWTTRGATCQAGTKTFKVFSSPYSSGCQLIAPLRTASSIDELAEVNCSGEILLMQGDLTREQLMPRNYPFYNPETHQYIHALLDEKAPAAIITATGRNPELAGAQYPFPLFEDGNFDIPSVFTTDKVGIKLAQFEGQTIHLISQAERIPSTGCNVVGRLNPLTAEKIVICAHVDAKIGTPGALDNSAGVVTLLVLADLLKNYSGDYGIELLVMNGEDYYGANGELLYLEQNTGRLGDIRLFINMDGLGYIKGNTAFSFYNLLESTRSALQQVLEKSPGAIEGEAWYQGDHAVMVMNGVPAVAITTEMFIEICRKYTHTDQDIPALVDVDKLVQAALVIMEMITAVSAEAS